jgi:type III secretory pathway component EscU
LDFKEKLSEPLFGHKGPVASIISAMIYYFGVGPFLIMVSFFIIWILIYCMISFVVSILLFTPFFDRTIESRDFMVIEQHVSSSGKGRSHRTVFKEVNGTLKANIDNKDFYRQVKTGSHLKITGTNTSVGFVYKIKDIEVLKD